MHFIIPLDKNPRKIRKSKCQQQNKNRTIIFINKNLFTHQERKKILKKEFENRTIIA